MNFGDNLRRLRKAKKLSQETLAEKMQVSRQSVSKWETGDAYPEMKHILALCRIFHCHINELVNDSLADAASLDEEVKSKVIKFKKEQQDRMKGLSKAILVIARVSRIVIYACIGCVAAMMILLAAVVNKIEVVDGELRYNGEQSAVRVEETEDRVSLTVFGAVFADTTERGEIDALKEMLAGHSSAMIVGYAETGLVFVLASLILACILLKALEKLFHNIHEGDTPFTLENVRCVKKMAYLMIALTVLPNMADVVLGMLIKTDFRMEFGVFSVIEILFLFSVAYIFQYGYEIQLDSQGRIYGTDA